MSFKDFTPTKSTLAWTAAGASVLTMVLGFTWGGWVTGGTAAKMAADASAGTHAELASLICATNFAATTAAREQQQEMLALSSYQQRGFVQKQPWALLPGESAVSRQTADLCVQKIAAMEPGDFPEAEEAAVVLEATEVDPG